MSRDLKILLVILAGIGLLIIGIIWFARPPQEVGTYWTESAGGDGPYKLKTGSRSEEERRKQLEHVIRLDGDFEVKENPSDTPVHFTTGPGVKRAGEKSPDRIPEVNY
jgi:hypothetical protein